MITERAGGWLAESYHSIRLVLLGTHTGTLDLRRYLTITYHHHHTKYWQSTESRLLEKSLAPKTLRLTIAAAVAAAVADTEWWWWWSW